MKTLNNFLETTEYTWIESQYIKMGKYINADSLKFLSIDGMYSALCGQNRNKLYPQFTDHYFTGEYPIEPIDQIKDYKVTQLSLLSGKSNN